MGMRIVQLTHPAHGRRVARVDEPRLQLLGDYRTVYDARTIAIALTGRVRTEREECT